MDKETCNLNQFEREDSALKGKKILIIDDERPIADLIKQVAAPMGFDVCATYDSPSFRDELKRRNPDIIILDLSMPDCDGIELLRLLAAKGFTGAIIIISGFEQAIMQTARRIAEALKLNVAETLTKPMRLQVIRDALRHAAALLDDPDGTKAISAALRQAISLGELNLAYQPKIELSTGRLVGVEALMRWVNPKLGAVPPAVFIAAAEEHCIIADMTEWALVTAIKQMETWQKIGLTIGISLNVSPLAIIDLTFPERVEALCHNSGISPGTITIEITESTTIEKLGLMDVLTRLRLKGFLLAIDDFGIGYSSLMHLRELPFTELKIDMAFVKSLSVSKDCRVIVDSVIRMGKGLGLVTTAEGVEDAEALSFLRQYGCDLAQGYYISPPLPGSSLSRWAATHEQNRSNYDV